MTHDNANHGAIAGGTLRISIVLATFNAEQYLAECFENIRRQTYPNRELIVMDGGSTDGTLAIIRDNADLISHWVSEPDRGIYHAWNKGMRFATGQWVLFRGADDLFWDPDALSRAATRLARAGPDQLIGYGRGVCIDEFGHWVGVMGDDWPTCRRRFFHLMNLPHPAMFHHVEAFRRYGEFDESFRIAGDYDFLLRVLQVADALFIADGITTAIRTGGISRRKNIQATVEALRARKKNNLPGFPYLLWRHMAICALSNMRRRAVEALLGRDFLHRAVVRRRSVRSAMLAHQFDTHISGQTST